MIPLEENIKYGHARGYEQYYIEEYKTRTGKIGEEISSNNRGNKLTHLIMAGVIHVRMRSEMPITVKKEMVQFRQMEAVYGWF